ncbi:MAG: family 43 glycosylhydrolase, partial [Burkholderiales bacterium]|nr:family 43 glycosylhydrolase [Opitutaceae bacterium]
MSVVPDSLRFGPTALPPFMPSTYCNPLTIPSYPRGKYTFAPYNRPEAWGWLQEAPRDFRELADPTVLWHEGRWYLFPSCGMAWVSEDFVTWTHHPIEPFDAGYAPTVAHYRGRFLMTASKAGLWEAPHPLGPWRHVGPIVTPSGAAPESWQDPMIFPDTDGRLYLYWGISAPGIFGAELDPERPERMLTEPRILFEFDSAHTWERAGDHNECTHRNFNEGAWMLKIGATYYLTYAGPGTEWKSYAMGCYRGDSPLGPFVYDESSPFCTKTDGLVQGPGHGCIVSGPGDTLWAFYTCRVCFEHVFERRIGMDRVRVREDGRLEVVVTETPQFAPGRGAAGEAGEAGEGPGWSP